MIAITLAATIMAIRFPNEVQQVSAQTPTVVVSRLYNFKESVGATFLVYINVSDVTDLRGFVMNISWNPEVIRLSEDPNGIKPLYNTTKYGIYFGDFLHTSYQDVESVNNDKGWIKYLWKYRASGGDSGSGVLVILNFTLVKIGTTKIELTNPISQTSPNKCFLVDKNDKEIAHDEVDGVVSDQPPPTPKFWEELWFQSTIVGVICVAGIIVLYKKVWKKVRAKRLLKMSREVQPIYEENEPNIQL
jgi:hypothetical protein